MNDEFLFHISLSFPAFGGIVDQQTNTEKIHMKSSSAYGHQIRGKISYILFRKWKIAAFGDYYYFKVANTTIKSDEEKIRTIGLPPFETNKLLGKGKAKKNSYSLSLEISYLF